MRRILLAETHDHLRGLLRERFEREGFTVDVAKEPEAALRLAKRLRPDLIVVSDALADPAGVPLWQRFERDAKLGGIPRILLSTRGGATASADADSRVARLEHPFRPAQLMVLARGALRTPRP